jgi:Uma2 family endonuclease
MSDVKALEKKFAYKDLAELDETKRYEILDGDLYEMPSPTTQHQVVIGRLFIALTAFVTQHQFGTVYIAPLDVVFEDETVLQPDLIIVSTEKSSIVTPQHIAGVPDLVIELANNQSYNRDSKRKKNIYQRFAVQSYWVIDLEEKEAELYILNAGKYDLSRIVTKSETLTWQFGGKEFQLPLSEIF